MSASAAAHGHDHHGEHVSSLGTYFTIFGLLIMLTILTVAVSYAGLPGIWAIVAALSVALVKAFLVAGWFMHLKYDTRFNLLAFMSAFWFMLVFFIFTLFDLGSRDALLQDHGTFEYRAVMQDKVAAPPVVTNHGDHGGETHGTEDAHGSEAGGH